MKQLAIIFILSISFSLFGELSFDSTEYKKDISFKVKVLKVEYSFENKTNKVINIDKIRSTCSCVVPVLTKKVYKPNETGIIKVNFYTAGDDGTLNKYIYVVQSIEKATSITKLSCQINIQKRINITPKLLYWSKQTKADTKKVEITINDRDSISLRSAFENTNKFKLSLQSNDNKSIILITPKNMDKTIKSELIIKYKYKGDLKKHEILLRID